MEQLPPMITDYLFFSGKYFIFNPTSCKADIKIKRWNDQTEFLGTQLMQYRNGYDEALFFPN